MKNNKTNKPQFRPLEFLIEKFVTAVAFISLAFIIIIFIFVFKEAAPIFSKVKPAAVSSSAAPVVADQSESYGEEYLSEADKLQTAVASTQLKQIETPAQATLLSASWQPVSLDPKYGLWPLIIGSIKVTLIALLFASPVAVLAALYSSTFAPKWSKEILKPAIEILAGIPSVVIGFFALIVLASVMQRMFGYQFRLNSLIGGLALSFAVIPIIYTISEDAISAVPKTLTEASLALGAQKWETALFVTLPAAMPGIFAAILLGVGRAFGETMIVLMATGNAALLSPNLIEPVRTMSATIGAEMAEVVFGDTHYNVLFFIGALLFAFSFSLNFIAEVFIRDRLMKRFKGN